MAIEFKLPDLGENIESGDVINVLVEEGQTIEAEQPVIELETDKATVEVPCPHAGRVSKLHVHAGDTVQVGAVVLTLEADGETAEEKKEPKAEPKKPAKAKKAAPKPKEEEPEEPEEEVAVEPPEEEPAEEEVEEEPPKKKPAAKAPERKAAKESVREASQKAPEAKAVEPQASETDGRIAAAGPATRRLARELGVDLSQVEGSGPGGRITEEDIKAAVRQRTAARKPAAPSKPAAAEEAAPPTAGEDEDAWGPIRRERMTKIRKTIATNMARSWSTIPHVTNFDDADITELDAIRKESTADYVGANMKLTMMPFIMKAVAHALRGNPLLNASIDLDNDQIVYKQYVNLGIAVDTERGLVVPVVRGADRLSIPQLAQKLHDLSEQVRSGKFAVEDLRGGTFTISNLGAVGGQYSTPIINHPEVAVLLVGRARKMPIVVDDEELAVRLIMPLSISYDHRLVDGATAARFLNDVITLLEAPGRLLLAP